MTYNKETIGDATLYMGDCLEIIASLDGVEFDAVVTDPPYCSGAFSESARAAAKGQGRRRETISRVGWFNGDNMGTAGLIFLLRSVMGEARKKMKPRTTAAVFMDWRMSPNVPPAIESAGLRFQQMVVWDKGSPGLGNGFRAQHELVGIYANGAGADFYSSSYGNVIRVPRQSNDDHFTQKPVALIDKLLDAMAAPGAIVLDPFMGSGTTGVSCAGSSRRFVGVEVDPNSFSTACRRIEDAYRQRRLIA